MTVKATLKKIAFGAERISFRAGLIPGVALSLPHFIGIGPGQTGSTWLARHLSEHADVYLTPQKETDYFSKNFHTMSLRRYASLFAEGRQATRGEISPSYSILTLARIRDIARLLPEVQLIITLRDPIERSWSAARRVMPRLGEDLRSISKDRLYDYLREEWAFRPANGLRMVGEYAPGLLEGNYSRIIDRWLEYFPAEQLLVTFFDDIKCRPAEVLQQVCHYIGVSADVAWDKSLLETPVNRNAELPMPPHVREFLQAMYRDEIETLAQRFGGPANAWLGQLT